MIVSFLKRSSCEQARANQALPVTCYSLLGLPIYRASDLVKKVLASAREQLDVNVAFISEVTEGQIAFRSLEGDTGFFRFREDISSPLVNTFCRRVFEGRVPYVVPDSARTRRSET